MDPTKPEEFLQVFPRQTVYHDEIKPGDTATHSLSIRMVKGSSEWSGWNYVMHGSERQCNYAKDAIMKFLESSQVCRWTHRCEKCSRCGGEHILQLIPLQNPLNEHTHWAMCPVRKEPILFETNVTFSCSPC
jgi:hypothetical protein